MNVAQFNFSQVFVKRQELEYVINLQSEFYSTMGGEQNVFAKPDTSFVKNMRHKKKKNLERKSFLTL